MKKWAIVLHFYQPPVNDLAITKQVLESSYMPVLRLIEENPHAKVTVNISACLLEQLNKLHKYEFMELLRKLHKMGKIEFLASPAYHPIAPLISMETLARQLDVAERLYEDLLGIKPGMGLFLPELAVTPELLNNLAGRYDYMLVDESGCGMDEYSARAKMGEVKMVVNQRDVCDVVRSYPVAFSGSAFAKYVHDKVKATQLMTMNDVEAFGHHYQERVSVLEQVFDSGLFEFCFVSELGGEEKEISLKASSWQHVLEQTDPFWLWSNPDNPMQQKYWELAKEAQQAINKWGEKTEGWQKLEYACRHLDMGLSSCYLYWLSNWPWWHPEVVENGIQQVMKAIRTLVAPAEFKIEFEKKHKDLVFSIWEYHWSGKVQEDYKAFDKERAILLAMLPKLD